jgi:hypothetical protein
MSARSCCSFFGGRAAFMLALGDLALSFKPVFGCSRTIKSKRSSSSSSSSSAAAAAAAAADDDDGRCCCPPARS